MNLNITQQKVLSTPKRHNELIHISELVHLRNIPITFLKIRTVFLLLKLVSELKFGQLGVGWKTSNILDFDVGKLLLWEKSKILVYFSVKVSIFEYLRH